LLVALRPFIILRMTQPPSDNTSFEDSLTRSPSYIPADHDTEFLQRDDLRSVRLGLEFLKPDLIQREQGIRSTVVVFGSARLTEPAQARQSLTEAEAELAKHPGNPAYRRAVAVATRHVALSRYYDEAREFGRLVSSTCQVDGRCDFVIVTGGGPGIMEAANRGAADAGAKSIGLNIVLPQEQQPNPYITTELCFQFRYFALRKMHFLLRAKALVAFPGGFGTFDELFDTLTLLQTGKVTGVCVVLVGRDFWERIINWPMLVDDGLISPQDLNLFHYAETAAETWKIIAAHNSVKPTV